MTQAYTPDPQANAMLVLLLEQLQAVIGTDLVGFLLDGSLANGGFDADSDIDFVVVTQEPVNDDQFLALQAMHDRLTVVENPWAVQLEGSYLSRHAIRRYDPLDCIHPNIERGSGERLKIVEHDAAWDIHRWVLRERGIVLVGLDARTLIDPVSPDRLREVMVTQMTGWGQSLLDHPERIASRGYQSYIVLSICRILYTLALGMVVSKQIAAHWAKAELGVQWDHLIERALYGRRYPNASIVPGDIEQTLAYLRFALARVQEFRARLV